MRKLRHRDIKELDRNTELRLSRIQTQVASILQAILVNTEQAVFSKADLEG